MDRSRMDQLADNFDPVVTKSNERRQDRIQKYEAELARLQIVLVECERALKAVESPEFGPNIQPRVWSFIRGISHETTDTINQLQHDLEIVRKGMIR